MVTQKPQLIQGGLPYKIICPVKETTLEQRTILDLQ